MLTLMDEPTRTQNGTNGTGIRRGEPRRRAFYGDTGFRAYRRRLTGAEKRCRRTIRSQLKPSGCDLRAMRFTTEPVAEREPSILFERLPRGCSCPRAKHRSLHGHPQMALTARALGSRILHIRRQSFFSSDSAPPDIEKKRREGFERLASLFQQRFPKTHRVERRARSRRLRPCFCQRPPRSVSIPALCPASTSRSDRSSRRRMAPRVRDIDGNWSYDLGGSYGVNLFGSDFYKRCIDRGVERARELGLVLGPVPSRDRRQRRSSEADFRARRGFVPHVGHRGRDAGGAPRAISHESLARRSLLAARITVGGTEFRRVSAIRARREISTRSRKCIRTRLRVLRTRDDIACVLVNPIQAMNPNGIPAKRLGARRQRPIRPLR